MLPQATALGIIHSGTMAGKLNGVMPATTPSGWRTVWTSTPVEAWELKLPLSRSPRPHANSMFSNPRATSPSASECTLPCSAVNRAAISAALASTRFRNECISFVRVASDVCRHSSKAALDEATAASTSSTLARPTSADCSPVAGLNTGSARPDLHARVSPFT